MPRGAIVVGAGGNRGHQDCNDCPMRGMVGFSGLVTAACWQRRRIIFLATRKRRSDWAVDSIAVAELEVSLVPSTSRSAPHGDPDRRARSAGRCGFPVKPIDTNGATATFAQARVWRVGRLECRSGRCAIRQLRRCGADHRYGARTWRRADYRMVLDDFRRLPT